MNMFGGGLPLCSLPLCQQPMMCPFDVPVPQPYPCPFPVPQPCVQNIMQPVDVPVVNMVQPVIVPTPVEVPVPHPVPVPVDRPCPVPVPQPVPVPVDRPCAVPVPVCIPVPQPCAVPQPVLVRQPVCVPVPVPTPVCVPAQQPLQYNIREEYYAPVYEEEYMYEEPIYIKHRRRRHHHHHHHHHRRRPKCKQPQQPIIIPIPIQGPPEQAPVQVTEYVQDIYPPAQVYSEQVPVGYVARNSLIQQPGQIQNQQSIQCQPAMIMPSPASSSSCVQQMSCGQVIQRPLSIGGTGGIQAILASPQQQQQQQICM